MRTIKIGDQLVSALFMIIQKSYCQQLLYFWDDAAATLPSDLSGVSAATLEVYVDATTTLTWPGAIISNQVSFNLTDTQTDVAWDSRPYNLVLTKSGHPYVVLSGEVVVQR